METEMRQRGVMAGLGAVAGVSLYALVEVWDQSLLPDRLALGLLCFAAVAFGAALALAGVLPLRRVPVRALGLGLVVAALYALSSLRFDAMAAFVASPFPVVAVLVLATLPLPFLIAQAGPSGMRDYTVLFSQSWVLLVRGAAAAVFVGLVWLVLLLSDALLSIVGVEALGDLLETGVFACALSGAVLGLGLAVVTELSGLLSPDLVLRLLRLLLPLVAAVMAVFLVAVPVQGFGRLFSGLSAALTLTAMAGAGIALVSVAVDRSDACAARSRVLTAAAQVTGLMLPGMAGLGAWAIWLRVAQYGWTPERLFAALVAGFALAYGVVYALAILRGAGWRGHVRRGNLVLALGVIVVAALWLTPALDAERISAASQRARFGDGRLTPETVDLAALDRWGRAGAAVRAELEQIALQPGQAALAARLAAQPAGAGGMPADPAVALATLQAAMPVQPATATATRDLLLAGLPTDLRGDWARACGRPLADGTKGCLLVVADLLPRAPGEEAVVLLNHGGWVQIDGLVLRDGVTGMRQVWTQDGGPASVAQAEAMLRDWAVQPPPLVPVQVNQLGLEAGLLMLP